MSYMFQITESSIVYALRQNLRDTRMLKHLRDTRITNTNLETHDNEQKTLFFFGMSTRECRIHIEKLIT